MRQILLFVLSALVMVAAPAGSVTAQQTARTTAASRYLSICTLSSRMCLCRAAVLSGAAISDDEIELVPFFQAINEYDDDASRARLIPVVFERAQQLGIGATPTALQAINERIHAAWDSACGSLALDGGPNVEQLPPIEVVEGWQVRRR